MRDRLREEALGAADRHVSILIAGHFPHLPRLLTLLLTGAETEILPFPQHGVVHLQTNDEGKSWQELWRT
jgi:phosphohistidine phosphatase SixA